MRLRCQLGLAARSEEEEATLRVDGVAQMVLEEMRGLPLALALCTGKAKPVEGAADVVASRASLCERALLEEGEVVEPW